MKCEKCKSSEIVSHIKDQGLCKPCVLAMIDLQITHTRLNIKAAERDIVDMKNHLFDLDKTKIEVIKKYEELYIAKKNNVVAENLSGA